MNEIKLRPYQENGRLWVNRQLNASRNPLLIMPTGTGKSKTIAMIASDRIKLKQKVLIIVPQDIIQEQLLLDFNFLDPGYINDEGVIGKNKNVYIAMAKSLCNMLSVLPENFIKSFDIIITDETQFSSAGTWRNIYLTFRHCLLFGTTATPYRMDNQPLTEFYDCFFEAIKMSEAIKAGYLCKPVIIVPDEYKNNIPENINSIDKEKQKEFLNKNKIIGDMIKVYNTVFNGLPVIIPATTSEHAEEICRMYNNAGWRAVYVSGKTVKSERKKIIRQTKEGKINQLVVVGVGIYGMDIPSLAGIIWMRYTESLTIYMQLNGRPMRPNKSKKHFIFIDPVGNSVIHGRPDIDRKWTFENGYKPGQDVSLAPKMKICPSCSVMNASENLICHICGYDFSSGDIPTKKRRLPVMVDGELVLLDESEIQEREQFGKYEQFAETKKQPEQKPKILTDNEKLTILKNGLGKKNNMFEKVKKEWMR